MKSITIDLETTSDIEIVLFSDEHIGDPHSNMKYLNERIAYVKNHKNTYCILGGDLIDNATKTSIGDTYSQTMNPQMQMDMLVDLFYPIKDKILVVVSGNHEARTYKKEGIDILKNVAERLGVGSKYDFVSVYLFLKIKTIGSKKVPILYRGYITHGAGGGRKEGAKAIRLADLASICDADFYVHNHSHLPMVLKEDYYRDVINQYTVKKITRLFVNSSANLEYGGYGEVIGCKPATIDKPIIHLSHKEVKATATL